MHEFFTPQHDHRLATRLRREALATRSEPKHLPVKVALAVRRQQASADTAETSRFIPRQPIVYATAALLGVALALPVLWNRISPIQSQTQNHTETLVRGAPMAASAGSPVPAASVAAPSASTVPAELLDASSPHVSEAEMALLTADMQAAVDTLLATLPVDVDIESLVLP